VDRVDELVALIDRILPEYIEIWNFRNFEMGIARFRDNLISRRAELLALRDEGEEKGE